MTDTIGPLPFELINGQPADGSQVQANLDKIRDDVNASGAIAPGTGNVVGPVSAVDGNLAVFNGATGKLLKDGGLPPSGGASSVDDLTDAISDGISTLYIGGGAGTSDVGNTSNTAVGMTVMPTNTSGNNNTVVGNQSLTYNSTGSFNTVVGSKAALFNTTGLHNTAVGYSALQYSSAQFNTAVGSAALDENTTGSYNTALGYNSGDVNTTGTYNTYIGYNARADANNYTNSTALGNAASISASNRIVLGNASIASIYAQVTTITGISDRRLKKDIVNLDLGLDFIEKLRPVYYRYNNGDETLRYGFIAQEVEKSLGGSEDVALVVRGTDKNKTYAMGYSELIAPIVKATQELTKKVNGLEVTIIKMQAQINALMVQ